MSLLFKIFMVKFSPDTDQETADSIIKLVVFEAGIG